MSRRPRSRRRHGGNPRDRLNAEQLRHRTDSGATGDKVAAPDPATAPLGADSEAGGEPMPEVPDVPVATGHTGIYAGPLPDRRTYLKLAIGLAAAFLVLLLVVVALL